MCCILEHYDYDDYKNWEGDWELINGVIYAMSPSPMFNHQGIASMILTSLNNSLANCKKCLAISEEDWKIDSFTTLRPDISLVCGQMGGAYIKKTPDLIVEIVSKSSIKRDEKIKFNIYEKEKVKYYILVYPDDLKAKIYKLDGKKYEKVGDFFEEKYTFDNLKCKAKINFKKVFEKFK